MPGNLNLKKSWHPGLLKNQKKIWNREQDALQEYQKIKERRKELEDEKERDEFIKLQYGDDLENLPTDKKLQLNKLDWMYDSPAQSSSGFNEMQNEFTEGKQKVEDLLSGRQAVSEGKLSRFEQTVSKSSTAKSKIDLSQDDPLMKIQLSLKRKLVSDIRSKDKDKDGDRKDKHRRHKHRSHHRVSKDSESRSKSSEEEKIKQRILSYD